jgi:hypothetical protein
MLNFITNQTKQYQAYTDRYFAFKVQYRKLCPRRIIVKNLSGLTFERAAEALRNFSEALRKSNIIFQSNWTRSYR